MRRSDPERGARPDPELLSDRLARIINPNVKSPFGVTGAVLAVSARAGAATTVAVGEDARGAAVQIDSLFTLASASKLATGLLILKLIEQGKMSLAAEIRDYVPDARAATWPGITLQRLLSHTSGMPLEVPHDLSDPPGAMNYETGLSWPGGLAEACLACAPTHAAGTAVQYSNVGFGLLGLAAERCVGKPLARLLDEVVFWPLGVEAYVDRLPERAPLAVYDVPSPHAGSGLEPYNSETWRLLGTPWAGVTTDAAGMLSLVRAYGDRSGFLGPGLAQLAVTDQTGGLSGGFGTTDAFVGHLSSRSVTWSPCPWGLAVEVQGAKQPHWGPPGLPNSFGQIGSSGCLAWYDPDTDVAWAVFGTRTTESGWLLRHGAKIAQSAIAAASSMGADAAG